ncbi:MFS transporter [Nonomuraea endophytica]|uniref:MFS family permease n=1 Tax=Nonomuraea endophytica TaxID=714136 RepID=A0A7W7ZZ34_9ACTN|nr:MFS transporter [Nonomuraea endophytica]MBB5076394.1 MFS family permease [Nonomuraea endophytica]
MTAADAPDPSEPVVLPDDLLPGAEATEPGLLDTLRHGGWSLCATAIPLVALEQLTRDATTTLAPDIRDYFGISAGFLTAMAGLSGVALTVGGIPMAWLADRVNRKHLVVASAVLGTCALTLAGLAQDTWQLLVAYLLTGVAAAYSNPVFLSMLSDGYPVQGRGRILSLHAMATPLGQALGPALAGGVAGLVGGPQAWRWAYFALAVPYALAAIAAAVFLREPGRGRAEQHLFSGTAGPPVGILQAFREMMRVKTFVHMCVGIGVLGLALATLPLQMSILLGDEYGFDASARGVVFSLAQIPVIAAMIITGHHFDRSYRRQPERIMHLAGFAMLAFGGLVLVGVWFPSVWPLLTFYVLACMCSGIALTAVNPLIASVTPPRVRTQAFAILPVFTFLMGGFLGSVFAGFVADSFGPRMALTVVMPLSAFAAGYVFLHSARYLRPDIAAALTELTRRA